MERENNNKQQPGAGRHEHPLRQEISREQKEQVGAAHDAAEKDMEQDADLTAESPNDDLDEGESARLGEDTDLI
jgi:hypothetical protein